MLCYVMFMLCLCYVYAFKGFILKLKICIKCETALPRLQGLKKTAHMRNFENWAKIGGDDEKY